MKNIFLLLLPLLLLLSACGEDEEPIVQTATFQYDGDNQTAPILDPGVHIMAARFTAAQTNTYQGKTLDRVEFFLLDIPSVVELRIYEANTASTPGDLLYTADLSSDLRSNSWIGHRLTTPLDISGEDLWIAIRVVHNFAAQSLGCDRGPASNNGDWILTDSATSWQTFREVTNNESSINWNIRGFVD